MKKHFSFYLFSLLASFSLIAQAMEAEKTKPELEALQKIAATTFPPPAYKNEQISDQEKLSKAATTVQDMIIFTVPQELFLGYIFPHMTPSTLLFGLGGTCHFFNQFSQLPSLYLNEYCLTERMPHAIPIDILRFKTRNTKGGLLKLATLVSVRVEDLCGWFDPGFLQSAFLSCQHTLPQQLEGNEETLGALYPVLKVALAATQADVITPQQKDHVMQLVREYAGPFSERMSLNKLRLLSLNPDRPGIYYETLEQLIQGQHCYPFRSTDVSISQAREVIARELLIKGRIVAGINSRFFVHNPQKKDVAIEIIELCLQYPQLLSYSHDNITFIHDSLSLGRSDLALKALSWVIKLPDDANSLAVKVQALAYYKDIKSEDVDIQAYLKQFSSDLYLRYWANLPAYSKAHAISLLIQAEKGEDVQKAVGDMLLQVEEEFLMHPSGFLLKELVDHNYSEEARKLILYALNIEKSKFISAFPYIPDHFFEHAVNVDREKTMALLKGYVESKATHGGTGLQALRLMAQFAAEDEKTYILSKIDSLNGEEMGDNFDNDLAAIYYYLSNRELCHFHYQKILGKLLKSKEQEGALHHFQEAGLKIICLEELQTMDPFEFFAVVLKKR